MWEVFYLGSAVPYGDKKGFEEIIEFLQRGQRLGKPPLCPKFVHELMLECWYENHLYRPRFKQLKTELKKAKPESEEETTLNSVIEKTCYMNDWLKHFDNKPHNFWILNIFLIFSGLYFARDSKHIFFLKYHWLVLFIVRWVTEFLLSEVKISFTIFSPYQNKSIS